VIPAIADLLGKRAAALINSSPLVWERNQFSRGPTSSHRSVHVLSGRQETVFAVALALLREQRIQQNTNARGYLIKGGLFNVQRPKISEGARIDCVTDGSTVDKRGGVAISDISRSRSIRHDRHFANISKRYQACGQLPMP